MGTRFTGSRRYLRIVVTTQMVMCLTFQLFGKQASLPRIYGMGSSKWVGNILKEVKSGDLSRDLR